MKKVLVLYSSYEGQTRRILSHILAQAADVDASWNRLDDIKGLDWSAYDEVLVGASIRYGHFPKALLQLAQQHTQELMAARASFIAVCLTARKPEKATPETNLYVRKWLQRSPWQPHQCAVFAGALCYSKYNWWQTRIIQFIMLLTGGSRDTSKDLEFTDWSRVAEFGRQLFAKIEKNQA